VSTFVQASGVASSTRATPGHQRGRPWGSATRSHTRCWGAATTRALDTTGISRLVGHQAVDVVWLELLAPAEERELDDEGAADDLGAGLLDELAARLRRPAGGDEVVVDEHAPPVGERVAVDLDRVDAVLELV